MKGVNEKIAQGRLGTAPESLSKKYEPEPELYACPICFYVNQRTRPMLRIVCDNCKSPFSAPDARLEDMLPNTAHVIIQ